MCAGVLTANVGTVQVVSVLDRSLVDGPAVGDSTGLRVVGSGFRAPGSGGWPEFVVMVRDPDREHFGLTVGVDHQEVCLFLCRCRGENLCPLAGAVAAGDSAPNEAFGALGGGKSRAGVRIR